jgi:hypothetical protein
MYGSKKMANLETAKLDPAKEFKRPRDVLRDNSLSREEKIDILRRWAYDEREKAVAEEENMQSSEPEDKNILDEILKCLIELKINHDQVDSPPTKQGG